MSEKEEDPMREPSWNAIGKLAAVVAMGLLIYVCVATVRFCSAPAPIGPTTCFIETYGGKMYLRLRDGRWGPIVERVDEAPAIAKLSGCELRP